jgi:Tol biopolymer transport system component
MWSPTGAELATIDGSTLSTIDPVTGETHNVGSTPEGVGDVTSPPAWSPDGTRFVFGAEGALYSIDARSGARSLLVRLPGEHLDSDDQIVWSPDGAHIAVVNDLRPGSGRVYVMDADGSNVRDLVDYFDPGRESGGVALSPDGTRLAYADASGPGGKLRIWVAPMDGSAPAEIGIPPTASCVNKDLLCDLELTWSPDGSRIAIRTYGDGSMVVSVIDADGSGDAVRIDELTYRSWDGGGYSWTSWGGR